MRRVSTIGPGLGVLACFIAASATAQPRWGRPSFPRDGACFYRDTNYRGDYFCTDQDISVLPNGMNDQITSIRTFGNVEVTIYQEGRFRGRSTQLRGDVRNVGDDWNDKISSVRVRGASRSGGYRPDGDRDRDLDRDRDRDHQQRRWTDREADAMVARAYRTLLGREPDPASRGWVDQVKSNNWSEQQLMDEMKKSPEYIAKHPRR